MRQFPRIAFLLAAASPLLAAGGSSTAGPPTNADELKARIEQLRGEYAPFLRSLPAPSKARQSAALPGTWRIMFELPQADTDVRPAVPEWFREDFDDSAWQEATVPEWRYALEGGDRRPVSCILWYRQRFSARPPQRGQRTFLVFAGVDWEAEVWLNDKFLGRHKGYCEPFRFEVTGLLKEKNTVAVRVIDGPRFGEPIAYWSVLPDPPATEQRYTRDPAKSIPGHKKGSQHLGSGFGIHREVYLETTDATCITAVFARGDPATGKATVQVETDSTEKWEGTMRVEISAENFWLPPMKQDSNESVYYEAEVPCKIPQGQGKHAISIPMPAAYLWSPATPYLYRCRVKIHNPAQQAPKDSNGGNPWLGPAKVRVDPPWVDAQDVLFGFRSFGIVSKANPRPGLLEGMFLLNGRPVFLRGANVSPALNLLWYWGQREKLIDAILMLKAANYNAVRVCQHVHFPEVRELLDRLGMMSEQDQGGGRNGDTPAARAELAAAGTALARACYNNPGVVLLSLGNEAHLDVTPVVAAVLAADPQRVLKPISGNGHPKGPVGYSFPAAYWNNVVDDFHFYRGWYGDEGRIWKLSQRRAPDRLVTVGEFGAEGLDAYETMSRHYPAHFGPAPPITADALWGEIQVKKADARQIWGFRGKRPANLGQYIEASQNYQADMLAEIAQGFRLSPRRIGGYFQFHFLDALPAHWPKAVVSHDFTPKRAYFAMAQVNQPLVPLFQLTEKGQSMEIWVANDLPGRLPGCRVVWTVEVCGSKQVIGGQMAVDVPGADAVLAGKVDLKALPPEADVVTVNLVLSDAAGKELSPYRREVFLKGWRLENAVFAEAKR